MGGDGGGDDADADSAISSAMFHHWVTRGQYRLPLAKVTGRRFDEERCLSYGHMTLHEFFQDRIPEWQNEQEGDSIARATKDLLPLKALAKFLVRERRDALDPRRLGNMYGLVPRHGAFGTA